MNDSSTTNYIQTYTGASGSAGSSNGYVWYHTYPIDAEISFWHRIYLKLLPLRKLLRRKYRIHP